MEWAEFVMFMKGIGQVLGLIGGIGVAALAWFVIEEFIL